MNRPSELEEFLHAHLSEAVRDSSGRFQLAREKALEKLATFQLPRESAWVLKVLQAVYASGAPALSITQTRTEIRFGFRPQSKWSLDEFELEYFNPENHPHPDLNHLKRALWGPGLHQKRPFRFCLQGSTEALLWDGQEFSRQPANAQDRAELTVSHRSRAEGRGLPILRDIQAARRNAAVVEELGSCAYLYPIPLQLDRRPFQGWSQRLLPRGHKEGYPIQFLLAQAPLPPLQFPDLAQDTANPKWTAPPEANLGCLLAGHFKEVRKKNDAVSWETFAKPSSLCWLLDGVIVDSQPLPLPESPLSGTFFASAQGLTSDLSGFRLQQNQQLEERIQQLLHSMAPRLSLAEIKLTDMTEKKRRAAILPSSFSVGMGIVGFFALSNPLMSAAICLYGAVQYFGASLEVEELEKILAAELKKWLTQWPSPSPQVTSASSAPTEV